MVRIHLLLTVLLAVGGHFSPAAQDDAAAGGFTREQAQQRITELESATGADENSQRQQLLELYRQILQRLDAARISGERADTFRQAIETAPAETQQLRGELTELRASASSAPERQEGETADSLQQRLTTLQADLAGLRAQLGGLERQLIDEQARPAQVQAQQADARATLAQIESQLTAASAPGSDSAESERAARALLVARQRARAAEIAMLEQELFSNGVRIELIQARRDLVARKVAQAEARETTLQTWMSQARKAEAERAREEADAVRRAALNKHPLIQEVAEKIASISRDTESILPRISEIRARKKEIDALLSQTRADLEETTRTLEVGITSSVGTILLEQRRTLPDARAYRRASEERSRDVADARLELFRIQRQLKELTDYEQAAERRLSELPADEVPEDDAADLRAELVDLLEKKYESLELGEAALRDYLAAVRVLETEESALVEVAGELAALLDEHLIWFPNAPALGTNTIDQLFAELPKLVSPSMWSAAVAVVKEDFNRSYTMLGLVGAILLTLLATRGRMLARLEAIAAQVGRVREDRVLLTFEALLLHVLIRLPVPIAGVFVGWRLSVAPDSNESSKAIGAGLVAAFCVVLAIQFLRSLFRKSGIAVAHFRWTERSARILRRHLLWYQAIALPTTFMIVMAQTQSDPLVRYGSGRLAFIVLMLAATVLIWFLLHPRRGLFVGPSVEKASIWLRRSRRAWLWIGLLVPFALVVMAATGYYYAALQLEFRLNQTILIILSALFIHAICLRWLMVSQRRLALKVALERRAALAKKNEAGEVEDSAATEGRIEALEEIDVAGIGDQTRDLLRISVGLYLAVTIWFAWVGVLPALGVLDDVPLWDHEVLGESGKELVPITLANLGLALLIVLMTVAAARNMPGFLEIAVLQRLPLEPGVRYATRTLLLYAIVSSGVVLAFNAIGVGWSSVQWLVAALTVGLGFGLQEIFANFVSGLIILLERPIRVGDTVTVGDTSGVVTRIRMRATTITDWNRRELVVPNKSFITGELINWSLSDPILRLDFVVGVAYGSDTILAHKTMLRVCHDHPLVLDQPEPNVFFKGFGDNSLNFEVRVFVSEPTNTGRSRVLHDLHMAIDQACREHDITIAFPQRDLHFKSSETVLRVAVEPSEPSSS